MPFGIDPDLHARASSQGYDSASNPAMVYSNTNGNHGGEMILAAKHTFSLPVEDTMLQMARSSNDEIPRFSSLEVRFGKMSILVVVAYFWCSEGLSARNWAILHQVSILIRQFKIPCIFFADFNMEPGHIRASGFLDEHASVLLVPNVDSTCVGSPHVFDYCITSATLLPMLAIHVVQAPWSPHVALHVQLAMVPRATMVRSIVEPLPLPMEEFAEKWKI